MNEIAGIGGVSRPIENRPATGRQEKRAESVKREDEVDISSEARRAAEVSRLVEVAKSLPETRENKVEQARSNLEDGLYRDESAVQRTAERFLDDLA